MNKELRDLTIEVRKLLLKNTSLEKIRDILSKKGYSQELISGALVQTQIKRALKRLKHRQKVHHVVTHSSHFSLIFFVILSLLALLYSGKFTEHIIFASNIMIKLFSISMIFKALIQFEIMWALSLIASIFIPVVDIAGPVWYYLVEFLKKKSLVEK